MTWAALWSALGRMLAAIAALLASRTTVPPTVPPNVHPGPPPVAPVSPQEPPTASKYDWSTPTAARHSARLICDEEGLPLARDIRVDGKLYLLKDILCACLVQESGLKNRNDDGSPMTHQNWAYLRGMKTLVSTDWGIAQVNDFWHIGPGKDFPSVAYVMDNPDQVVRWMAQLFKAGKMNLWVSYSSGAYRQWL